MSSKHTKYLGIYVSKDVQDIKTTKYCWKKPKRETDNIDILEIFTNNVEKFIVFMN